MRVAFLADAQQARRTSRSTTAHLTRNGRRPACARSFWLAVADRVSARFSQSPGLFGRRPRAPVPPHMVKAVPTGRGRTTRSFASPWQPGGQSDSAAAERGLDLLGPPVAEDEEAELTEVAAYAPQLIAYWSRLRVRLPLGSRRASALNTAPRQGGAKTSIHKGQLQYIRCATTSTRSSTAGGTSNQPSSRDRPPGPELSSWISLPNGPFTSS
jgi:hypothetical protein